MSKTINSGFTDTAISGVSSLSFPRGLINFGADFREKETDNKNTVILTNITSPVDRPEQFRFAFSDIKDVYANTGVDQSVMGPSKKGFSFLSQLTEVLSVTDSADASVRIDLPVSAHIVVKAPSSEYITAEILQTLIGRLVSGLYETGVTDTARIKGLIRGSLTPRDI